MFSQDFDINNMIDGNNNVIDQDLDIDINMNSTGQNNMEMGFMGTNQSPIIEPMQERQVHRTIMHQVEHICPIRTRIINHHIIKHNYCPQYSCCEENVISNIDQGSCCNFR